MENISYTYLKMDSTWTNTLREKHETYIKERNKRCEPIVKKKMDKLDNDKKECLRRIEDYYIIHGCFPSKLSLHSCISNHWFDDKDFECVVPFKSRLPKGVGKVTIQNEDGPYANNSRTYINFNIIDITLSDKMN